MNDDIHKVFVLKIKCQKYNIYYLLMKIFFKNNGYFLENDPIVVLFCKSSKRMVRSL